MSYQHLQSLAQSYSPGNSTRLLQLAKGYARRREQEILDIASVAANVSVNSVLNLGLEPEMNPSLETAFALQYPNKDFNFLEGKSEEYLNGIVNQIKGKYFEVLVRDRLNSGERLGELMLSQGQKAVLAESLTQPGWDLKIINEDGSTAELLQLKATKSMAYIKEAFDKYPDIRIATPSEVDGTAEQLLQTNISNEEIKETAQNK